MTLPDGRKWALKCTSVLKNDLILGLFKLINDGVYKNDLMESKKRTRTTRKTDLILFYLEIYFLFLVQVGFLPPSTAFLCQAAKFKALKGPLFRQWTLWSHLVRMQCSSGGTRSVSLYSGHSFVVSLSRERWNYLKATSTRIRIFLKPFFRPF